MFLIYEDVPKEAGMYEYFDHHGDVIVDHDSKGNSWNIVRQKNRTPVQHAAIEFPYGVDDFVQDGIRYQKVAKYNTGFKLRLKLVYASASKDKDCGQQVIVPLEGTSFMRRTASKIFPVKVVMSNSIEPAISERVELWMNNPENSKLYDETPSLATLKATNYTSVMENRVVSYAIVDQALKERVCYDQKIK
jgi:hypothetical protein